MFQSNGLRQLIARLHKKHNLNMKQSKSQVVVCLNGVNFFFLNKRSSVCMYDSQVWFSISPQFKLEFLSSVFLIQMASSVLLFQ